MPLGHGAAVAEAVELGVGTGQLVDQQLDRQPLPHGAVRAQWVRWKVDAEQSEIRFTWAPASPRPVTVWGSSSISRQTSRVPLTKLEPSRA